MNSPNILPFSESSKPLKPAFSVRYLKSGMAFSPFTSTLENWGNVTPKRPVQKVCISPSVPGAWLPNWFQ